ncbi:MAG: Phosphoribosylformylglycinamidine synthase, PurS subunit (EC [uncultured Sulfurovum sp.]|uniref:Phosphoribosylformylglycinamidine synthase subunit PurS n=1 Tax=uncultured Sulfurovum sp. TaxID=269237 RepID=A0A6S6SPE0_9BACT|nr:MAG: Phosphoribosylformylglycinamidine synthase, PurS subunit (EC [uncultured Sulfurovum sp.]
MTAIVNIFLKEGVLDPQGKAIHHALDAMNFEGVEDVRMGKQIVLKLTSTNKEDALKEVEKMAEDILANTVIEDYKIELV